MTPFQLIPFPLTDSPFPVSIAGGVRYQAPRLHVHYQVRGDFSRILLPVQTLVPRRLHDLWRATCFEFFIASFRQPDYWEVNLSPSGDWNCYHFTGYRQGLREESRIGEITSQVLRSQDALALQTTLNLSLLLNEPIDLEIGVSCVLQSTQNAFQYWALTHCGQEPDFHHRDSFLLRI